MDVQRCFAGIPTDLYLLNQDALKRACLMFDRLLVDDVEQVFRRMDLGLSPRGVYRIAEDALRPIVADLEFLRDQGVLTDLDTLVDERGRAPEERAEFLTFFGNFLRARAEQMPAETRTSVELKGLVHFFDLEAREPADLDALEDYIPQERWIEEDHMIAQFQAGARYVVRSLSAIPLLSHKNLALSLGTDLQPYVRSVEVADIVLKSVPVPDASVPLQEIVEFRSNPDMRFKIRRLSNWSQEVARSDLTPRNIEEKIEWLLTDYEQALRDHEFKISRGMVESVVVAAADFAENFAKLRWGKLARALFSLKTRKTEIIEAERAAPGREVAYLFDCAKSFSRS